MQLDLALQAKKQASTNAQLNAGQETPPRELHSISSWQD